MTVGWDAPLSDGGAPITGYVVERRDASRKSWVRLATVGPDAAVYQAAGLLEGEKYYFRVFAENRAGVSAAAATLQQPACAKLPYGESKTGVRLTSVNVKFVQVLTMVLDVVLSSSMRSFAPQSGPQSDPLVLTVVLNLVLSLVLCYSIWSSRPHCDPLVLNVDFNQILCS